MKTKSKAKKIIDIVLMVFTVLLFALAVIMIVFTLVSRAVNKNKIASIFGYSYAVVVTGSMEPNIHIGDVIFFKEVDASEINVDDIIVFDDGEKPVVHRVIAKTDSTVTTKGDANGSADSPISYDKIYGKVTGQSSALGKFLDFMREPVGFVVVIAVPLSAVLIWEAVSLIIKLKKGNTNDESDSQGGDASDPKKELEELKARAAELEKENGENTGQD